MSLLFQNKVDYLFIDKVQDVADRLGFPANWLMAVIELETAGTFDPAITNSLGYTGLIQFGEAAAERIGTSRDELRKMTSVEQLEYVYKYLYIYRHKITSYVDLYLSVFFPAAMDKPLDYVLETSRLSASKIALNNPLFDINKDEKITVQEIQTKLLNRVPESFHVSLSKEVKKKVNKVCPTCGSQLR